MRGSSLSNPDLIEALAPFVVAVWNGRNTREMPDNVRAVYETGPGRRARTNLLFFVLDADGKTIEVLDPFPGKNPSSLGFDRQEQARYLLQQIREVSSRIDLPTPSERSGRLNLPEISGTEQPSGLRMLLHFQTRLRSGYSAPVVEVLPLTRAEREALKYPQKNSSIDTRVLKRWLSPFYPPAIMDGMGVVEVLSDSLTFRPAGTRKQGDFRYAILEGEVRFILDNRAKTTYTGRLQLVLRYRVDSDELESFRGSLDGLYVKTDRHRRRGLQIPMVAAIESTPN